MGLNETTRRMRELLASISVDIEKAANGNKAASQRVRTGSIRLEKTAKLYRKESISAEKSGNWPKKSKKAQPKSASKQQNKSKNKMQTANKGSQKGTNKSQNKSFKQAKLKARPKAKSISNISRRNQSVKHPTAKIPFRKI